jgi:Immunity protein 70
VQVRHRQPRRQGLRRYPPLVGLYLVIFGPDDDELGAVDFGRYSDFGRFRDAVAWHLEPLGWGTRFPVLMLHEDADGEWSPAEAAELERELFTIDAEFARLPPEPLPDGWQTELAKELNLVPGALNECFFDVNGDSVLERLVDLCRTAVREQLPILFQ